MRLRVFQLHRLTLTHNTRTIEGIAAVFSLLLRLCRPEEFRGTPRFLAQQCVELLRSHRQWFDSQRRKTCAKLRSLQRLRNDLAERLNDIARRLWPRVPRPSQGTKPTVRKKLHRAGKQAFSTESARNRRAATSALTPLLGDEPTRLGHC